MPSFSLLFQYNSIAGIPNLNKLPTSIGAMILADGNINHIDNDPIHTFLLSAVVIALK